MCFLRYHTFAITDDIFYSLYQQQQNLIEQWRDAQLNYYQNTYGHNTYPNGGVGAAATATYGPGGVHQTASLYPSNPVQYSSCSSVS